MASSSRSSAANVVIQGRPRLQMRSCLKSKTQRRESFKRVTPNWGSSKKDPKLQSRPFPWKTQVGGSKALYPTTAPRFLTPQPRSGAPSARTARAGASWPRPWPRLAAAAVAARARGFPPPPRFPAGGPGAPGSGGGHGRARGGRGRGRST